MKAYELVDGGATASVFPERGGLVSSFTVAGAAILYLDPATLEDPTKNVRGGIPILFPFPGKPPSGSPLKQHGFARNLPWRVLDAQKARLVCGLEAGASTRAAFPHEFQLELAVRLADGTLTLDFDVRNRGATAMPLHFGLHPYFHVPLEAKPTARIETRASQAFDQVRGQTGPVPRIDFGVGETDLHLLDHDAPGTVLQAGGRALTLGWSPNFTTLVLWTLPDRPFVCVEPWSAPAGSSKTVLAPSTSAAFRFWIRAPRA